jgi:hypothetical protein
MSCCAGDDRTLTELLFQGKVGPVFSCKIITMTFPKNYNEIALESLAGGLEGTETADTLIVSPNPFDSVAVIEFSIANNDTIWVGVFNVTGSTVKTYYNATVLSSGTYTLNFDGDTLPNGIYFVRLKINSTITQTVKLIKNANAVGINEGSMPEYNFVIYPNPTTSIMKISDEQNQFQNATIEIKNYFGHVVYTNPFSSQIDLHNLSAGMYFLTIQDKGNKKTIKVVKE